MALPVDLLYLGPVVVFLPTSQYARFPDTQELPMWVEWYKQRVVIGYTVIIVVEKDEPITISVTYHQQPLVIQPIG